MGSNQKGFSLISVMASAGGVAVVAMGMLRLSQLGANLTIRNQSALDYASMHSEVISFIQDPILCQGSFGGEVFNGASINATPLSVSLWRVNRLTGKRVGESASFDTTSKGGRKKFGKLTLKKIHLTIPEHTSEKDFEKGITNVQALLTIEGVKKVSTKKDIHFKPIKKKINLSFSTRINGTSTIIKCSMLSALTFTAPVPWIKKDASMSGHIVRHGDKIMADTSTGEVEINLPKFPSLGDEVEFMDAKGSFEKHNLIIKGNSNKINQIDDTLIANINNFNFSLVFIGSDYGWRVHK